MALVLGETSNVTMTCSLVVNSKSGNTRMVSGAIKRALQAAGVEFVHAAALSDDADADQVCLLYTSPSPRD